MSRSRCLVVSLRTSALVLADAGVSVMNSGATHSLVLHQAHPIPSLHSFIIYTSLSFCSAFLFRTALVLFIKEQTRVYDMHHNYKTT